MKTFELRIDETCRGSLNEEPNLFNIIKESFKTKEELKNYLIERYGKMPNGKNKVYIDINGVSKQVGFLHSFWNQDISHMTPKWFQTDWITFWEESKTKTYISL